MREEPYAKLNPNALLNIYERLVKKNEDIKNSTDNYTVEQRKMMLTNDFEIKTVKNAFYKSAHNFSYNKLATLYLKAKEEQKELFVEVFLQKLVNMEPVIMDREVMEKFVGSLEYGALLKMEFYGKGYLKELCKDNINYILDNYDELLEEELKFKKNIN